MKFHGALKILFPLVGLLSFVVARADRIELLDGSVVVGKLLAAEVGRYRFETGFAGTIWINQEKIKSIETDAPVNVGLSNGEQVLGRFAYRDGAGVLVGGEDGQMHTRIGHVTAIWPQGAESPDQRRMKEEAEKRKRKWSYEATVAITGRSGSREKLNSAAGLKATLASSRDKLILALAAERARDNGIDTSDRQYGSVDYSSFVSPDNGWYARTLLETDKIKGLDFRSTTAAGYSRKLINRKLQTLEVRAGGSYVYENYISGTRFESPGLDVAVLNSYQFANAKLSDALTYTPALKEFSNYRLKHEASLELPLGPSLWKLKLGVTNDFLSIPPVGKERLDTTYFTSLLLSWD